MTLARAGVSKVHMYEDPDSKWKVNGEHPWGAVATWSKANNVCGQVKAAFLFIDTSGRNAFAPYGVGNIGRLTALPGGVRKRPACKGNMWAEEDFGSLHGDDKVHQ